MRFSWVLSRYLSKHFVKSLLVVFGVVFSIVFLFDLSELLRKASTKPNIGIDILIQLTLLKVPGLIQQILPFIFFFAAILAFWSLNRQSEIIVLKASGVSIWDILFPLVVVSFFLGALDLGIINPLSARMMMRYEHLENRYFQETQGSLALSDAGLWIREHVGDHHNIIHVNRMDVTHQTLSGVMVIQFDQHGRFYRRIDGKTGVFRLSDAKGRRLALENVWIATPDDIPSFAKKASVKTTLSLHGIQDMGATPSSVSFWDLRSFGRLLEKSGLSAHKYLLYWHSLLARIVWLAAMVMLGASCATRPVRQGKTSLFMAAGAVMAFVLYFIRDMTYSLGNAQSLPIMMAAWIPVSISLLLGLSILLHDEDR